MQPDREPLASFHCGPAVTEPIGQPKPHNFGIESHRVIHIADEYRRVAARDHLVSPSVRMMADQWQNGKNHLMEPLSKRVVLPDILLDRNSREPLYHQITRRIADAIRSDRLGCGVRLPSTRSLSLLLGVSRNIVIIAYENLAADGLIRSKPGSGASVSHVGLGPVPRAAALLSAAMYPEALTLFDDMDGNPLYIRHPQRH